MLALINITCSLKELGVSLKQNLTINILPKLKNNPINNNSFRNTCSYSPVIAKYEAIKGLGVCPSKL